MNRAGKACAALLMWALFAAATAATLIVQPLAILVWLVTGQRSLYIWVNATGKAADQLVNAAIFGGHHKETVSSHAGRWYERRDGNPHEDPPITPADPMIEIPMRFYLVHEITNLFEADHVLKSVEAPFRNAPLKGHK